MITDGKNGILLKNDSVEEISHGMALGVSLLSHREERAKKNQEIIRSRFAWKEKLKEFVSLYRLLFIKR